ncbi:uncharacterized protein SPSK_10469 [Sporothrix schenckii 1099-18]|uniref:Uncharacterized protein n=1 Tax=Sporothrix schenckii 1099-18 TaxID=1397361 RepID=A0A0F2MDE5_SPOSC|nr:uncharacterized protein SPSK_10469 [Sporothrix schenckii 1099-18]KJR86161.1 hypothetical protein SPSK_10469 [Sporothrix schenckii 1099-18]
MAPMEWEPPAMPAVAVGVAIVVAIAVAVVAIVMSMVTCGGVKRWVVRMVQRRDVRGRWRHIPAALSSADARALYTESASAKYWMPRGGNRDKRDQPRQNHARATSGPRQSRSAMKTYGVQNLQM